MSHFDQMRDALDEAEQVQRAADRNAGTMARMLRGRLRHVPDHLLRDLKRELTQYDAHKARWKN